MIFNFTVEIITSIFIFLFSFLPDVDPATVAFFDDNLDTFMNMVGATNWFFPVPEFFFLMSVVFLAELALLLWKILRFIVAGLLFRNITGI